jgi:hypothetical protein
MIAPCSTSIASSSDFDASRPTTRLLKGPISSPFASKADSFPVIVLARPQSLIR